MHVICMFDKQEDWIQVKPPKPTVNYQDFSPKPRCFFHEVITKEKQFDEDVSL